MGMSKSIYIGAYMTVPVQSVEVEERYPSCYNKKCNNHRKRMPADTFCPLCGKEILVQNFKKTSSETIFQKLIDTDGELAIAEDDFHIRENKEGTFSYLMCNWRGKGTHLDEEVFLDDTPCELSKEIISQMTSNYLEIHRKSIDIIRKVYGKDASSIKFGVIQFWW